MNYFVYWGIFDPAYGTIQDNGFAEIVNNSHGPKSWNLLTKTNSHHGSTTESETESEDDQFLMLHKKHKNVESSNIFFCLFVLFLRVRFANIKQKDFLKFKFKFQTGGKSEAFGPRKCRGSQFYSTKQLACSPKKFFVSNFFHFLGKVVFCTNASPQKSWSLDFF